MGKRSRQQPQQIQVPISRRISYDNCIIEVAKLEDGGRALTVLDPVAGVIHIFPLSPEVARQIGNQLFSAVPVASAGDMPGGAA